MKNTVVNILVTDFGFCFEQAEFVVLKYATSVKKLLYKYRLTQMEVATSLAQIYDVESKKLEG